MTTVTANTLSLGFSLLAICFYWSVIVATIFCTVTTISALATTIVSHMFVSKLVTTTANLKTSGTGKLTTEWGHLYSRTAWAYCGFSFTALLILFFILWGQRRERHKQFRTESQSGEKVPFVGVIRRATGDLFQRGRKARYVNVEADEFAVASSRNASQENLMPRSRQTSGAHSHTPSRDGSRSRSRGRSPVGEVPSERGVVLETETAYEPMRHRTLPE
jgi:hypothetical protein